MTLASDTHLLSPLVKTRSRVGSVLDRRATWVMIDQAVVSAGNFLTGNLLGRTLPQDQYGIFGLLLESMLYLNSLQAALVIYPLTIRGATSQAKDLGRLATASCLFTLALLPVLGAAICLALGAMGAGALAIVGIGAMLLWQIQETLRRGLISELRIRESVLSDSISYLGQAAVIFFLARAGMLNLRSALVAMALTSAAAIGVQAIQIGMSRITRHDVREIAVDFWRLGRWMILSNAGSLVTTLGYWWTLRWTHGLNACGIFNAIIQMFKLANPITSGMTALIVPAVARAAARENHQGVRRLALRYIATGAALLTPYFLLLAILPSWTLGAFYRRDSAYVEYGPWLQLSVVNFTLAYFATVIGAWLVGLGQSRQNFFVQMICVGVTLMAGLPLTAVWGVPGVIIGGLFSALAAAVASGWFIHRNHQVANPH